MMGQGNSRLHSHLGLKRLRIVGVVAIVLGIVAIGAAVVPQMLGYAPDAFVVPLFSQLWPLGMVLFVLGVLLCVAAWVLQGFVLAEKPGEK